MQIQKPVIILGTGRCGSTVFYEMFAEHPQAMWFSGFCARYPKHPDWNRIAVSVLDFYPLIPFLQRYINPSEHYEFWEQYCPGFSIPCRDLLASDVTPVRKKRIHKVFGSMLTQTRNRMMIKITGWSRLGYLNEIFPDAKFIHIYRDGRAVANSFMETEFWRGWEGPDNWTLGPLPSHYQAEWEQHDQSFVALAGIYWKVLMDAIEKGKQAVDPARFFEASYEEFCTRPNQMLKEACEFAEIDYTPEFERRLKKYTIRNTNDKWRNDLTPPQQAILDAVCADHLKKYGYNV